MARFAPSLTLRVLPGAVAVLAVAALVVGTRSDRERPPEWLEREAAKRASSFLDAAEPRSVVYHLGERRHHAIFRFGRTLVCDVCTGPSDAARARGNVVQLVFDARTRRLERFALCSGTDWCMHPADT